MSRARGFTLIELIIVIIVIGIMAAALAPLALSSLRAYDDVLGDVVVLDKLRYATERLAREIREVKHASSSTSPATTCPAPAGGSDKYCFTAMNPHDMTFARTFHEVTGTPDVTVTVNTTDTVSASCINSPCVTLAYSSGGGTQTLTDELGVTTNLAFTYLDVNGNPLGTPIPATVHAVRISLTLHHGTQDYTQQTQVELKNR